MAFAEGGKLSIDDLVAEVDGLLIKLVAGDAEGRLLLCCDEYEAADAGDALIPSGLDMVAELLILILYGHKQCLLIFLEK